LNSDATYPTFVQKRRSDRRLCRTRCHAYRFGFLSIFITGVISRRRQWKQCIIPGVFSREEQRSTHTIVTVSSIQSRLSCFEVTSSFNDWHLDTDVAVPRSPSSWHDTFVALLTPPDELYVVQNSRATTVCVDRHSYLIAASNDTRIVMS
ncbi:hypothetical protein KCV07_g78, partial [Aureobasidium melanogenum]